MSISRVFVCSHCTLENPFTESVCRACRSIFTPLCRRYSEYRIVEVKEYGANGQLLCSFPSDQIAPYLPHANCICAVCVRYLPYDHPAAVRLRQSQSQSQAATTSGPATATNMASSRRQQSVSERVSLTESESQPVAKKAKVSKVVIE